MIPPREEKEDIDIIIAELVQDILKPLNGYSYYVATNILDLAKDKITKLAKIRIIE